MSADMPEHQKEKIVLVSTTHWMKYFPSLVLSSLLGMSGLILLIAAWFTQSIPPIALLLFCVGFLLNIIAHHRFFHTLLSEEVFDIIVTTKRILYFDDCLFFCDDEHEVPLHKVSAVEAQKRGILQNILNFGTMWFDTGGGVMDLKRSIPYVSKPDHISEIIADMLEEVDNRKRESSL